MNWYIHLYGIIIISPRKPYVLKLYLSNLRASQCYLYPLILHKYDFEKWILKYSSRTPTIPDLLIL